MGAILFLPFPILLAQTSTPSNLARPLSPLVVSEKIPNTVNCFDYYHFGSVQVDVSPSLSSTVSGAPMHFVGKLKNANDYPLVDGQVYAKVFYKNQKDESSAHQNGFQLVDQFLVSDGIVLNAKQEKPIEFDWKVPAYTESGDYQVAMFFTSAKRFNLLGLSFTDDVTGNKAEFSVKGEAKTNVAHFDKNNVMLNATPFSFAAFPPHFAKYENVVAHTTLVNPNKSAATIEVSYDLYAWDAMRTENLKSSKKETVVVLPGESKILSYEAPVINATVSYLVVTAKDKDTKSILDIRFVREGIDETRINFPGITRWPLKAGEENILFSCVHSTNSPVVEGNTLTLTLKNSKGDIIHAYTYIGDITGSMMGVKDSFTPQKDTASFTLTATLKHGDMLVDEVTQKYDCSAIDPTLCPQESRKGFLVSLLIILGVVSVLGGIMTVWRRTKVHNVTNI